MAKKKTTEVVEEVVTEETDVPKVEATLVEKDGDVEHYEADVTEVVQKMKSVKSPTRGGDLVVAEEPSNCLVEDKSYSYIWFNTRLSTERVCDIIDETLKNGGEIAPESLQIGIELSDPEAVLTINHLSGNRYTIQFDGDSKSGASTHYVLFDSSNDGWNQNDISQFESDLQYGFESSINQVNYPESFQELLGATIKGPYYPLVKDKNYSYIWLNTNLSNETVNEIIYNIVSQSSEAIVEDKVHKVEILSFSGEGESESIKIYLGYIEGKTSEPHEYFIGNHVGDIGNEYFYYTDGSSNSSGWSGVDIFDLFDSLPFFPITVSITSLINESDYPDMMQLLAGLENYSPSPSKNPSNFEYKQKGNKVYMTIGDGRITIPWDKRFVDSKKGESIEIIPAKLTIKGYYRANNTHIEYDPVTEPIEADEDGNVTLPEYPDFDEFSRVTKGYSFDKNAKAEDLLHEGDIVNIKDDAVIYNVIIQIYL